MKVLHLRKDPTFARTLREALAPFWCGLHSAADWQDLFDQLPDGPCALAVLELGRSPRSERQYCLHLAGATAGRMPLYLVTADAAFARALQQVRVGLFRVVPPTGDAARLRLALRDALDRQAPAGPLLDEWEPIAPDLWLRRLPGRWSVRRADYPAEDRTGHEVCLLSALLEAAGRPVPADDLARRLYEGTPAQSMNALRIAVGRLREKLGEDGARPRHLVTLPGLGYLWRP